MSIFVALHYLESRPFYTKATSELNKTKKESRGIYSRAIRQYFPDLAKANFNDKAFQAALQLAKRSYDMFVNPSDEEPPVKKLKQTFRLPEL